ncbi:MAG: ribulose bisphosphate carboxylase small subunit [Cyanobacteria bacterium J06554_11]
MAYYISPRFLNKLAVHITKNYLDLPQIKVPLILGIHGRKGEGKTFQCELVFQQMGVEVVHISGGELESPDAGDPARLIRLRYREAADLVRVRGRMAVLMINDLDAGAGRFDRMTQYTVNTQLVNNTLMNIADNPTNVQLPGSYDEKPLPRIPIVATGNDFATLYAPLIRDGRMQKFYWEPSFEDRLGVVGGMFADDGLSDEDIQSLVTRFRDQAIDFFGAVRSQIYDEQITQFIHTVGISKVAASIVNAINPPTFAKPSFQLPHLIEVGERLEREQARVRTMGLVSEYNQAVTPAGRSTRTPRRYEESLLLTPPVPNGLTPYAKGDSSSGSDTVSSSLWKRARQARVEKAAMSSSSGIASNRKPDLLSPDALEQVNAILTTGCRLGVEHVDQRRFRTNSWQTYATLSPNELSGAVSKVRTCIAQYPDHYVRLVSIHPQSKQRMAEKIISRPR